MDPSSGKNFEGLSNELQKLKIVEKNTALGGSGPGGSSASEPMEEEGTTAKFTSLADKTIAQEPSKPNLGKAAVSSETCPKLPTVIIVLGMAGSGKTTLTGKLISYLTCNQTVPYVINLDPACLDPPYGVNIDIRDTIDYKQVMKSHKLGPNGAIVTCINLFSTKFDEVMELLKRRSSTSEYVIIDTPGQLEVFMWSASGSIITELIAANFPTIMLYVADLSVTKTPISFISNMTYACSVLYKSRLPLVLALNKCDLQGAEEIISWITDFEKFQSELGKYEGQTVNLASSLSLVLDDFYSMIKHYPVSAMSGEGIRKLVELVDDSVAEYHSGFKASYQKLQQKKEKRSQPSSTKRKPLPSKKTKDENPYAFSETGSASSAVGFSLTLDSSSEGGESEEEDPADLDDDESVPLPGKETIREIYMREADKQIKKSEQE